MSDDPDFFVSGIFRKYYGQRRRHFLASRRTITLNKKESFCWGFRPTPPNTGLFNTGIYTPEKVVGYVEP